MHTLLIAVSLLLALGGSLACVWLLRFACALITRRLVALAGLLIPALSVVLLSVFTAHFLAHVCFLAAPPLDVAITQALIGVGALGLAIAFTLNVLRATLLPIQMKRRSWEAPSHLLERVRRLACGTDLRMSLSRVPGVRVCADTEPWALAAGLLRPQLVVSSGLLAFLDDEELDAVLTHELQHVRRGDLWWTALCGVLRDLTWFLPATRHLYALMLSEQEMACDDAVAGEPRRLALASALVRVWQKGLRVEVAPPPRGSLAFLTPRRWDQVEERARRLLDHPGVTTQVSPYKAIVALGVLLAVFMLAQIASAMVAMQGMGCDIHQLMPMH
ncbi:MAG TPA: M56 family metallopeptidase [Chloroflexia bacterium]|jgi:Zn-dependent protease with chaperone function